MNPQQMLSNICGRKEGERKGRRKVTNNIIHSVDKKSRDSEIKKLAQGHIDYKTLIYSVFLLEHSVSSKNLQCGSRIFPRIFPTQFPCYKSQFNLSTLLFFTMSLIKLCSYYSLHLERPLPLFHTSKLYRSFKICPKEPLLP